MSILSEQDKFEVLRPILGQDEQNYERMPIIKDIGLEDIDFDNLEATNYQNISVGDKNKIAFGFGFDKILLKYWNHPLKYLVKVKQCGIIATPDYSVYPQMNIIEVAHNVYKNRWLGVLWQEAGATVVATMSWSEPYTYDICFSGVEKGAIVAISTIGAHSNVQMFLDGFNEMKKRICPRLIIVFGDMIQGMTGRFLNFKYEETLKKTGKQQKMKQFCGCFEIGGVACGQ